MIKIKIYHTFLILAFTISHICFASDDLRIVTTIKPFYNLVSSISNGISRPTAILLNNACPHDCALKPSDIKKLNQANLVIWGGSLIEPFMEKAISKLPQDITIIDLSKIDGIHLLPNRSTHSHSHGDHGHDHSHGDHDHSYDPHYWLSPQNAKVILKHIATIIKKHHPSYERYIEDNLQTATTNIDYAIKYIKNNLATRQVEPFLTFHDAYQYFEEFFSIKYWGSITINPESPPTAKHLQNIHSMIKNENIMCIYAEPQFSAKIINSLKAKFPKIEYLTLDPMGNDKNIGPNGYIALLESLTDGYMACSTKSQS